jgi:hypothetical protein
MMAHKPKYEIQVRRDLGWTNDIAGCETDNEFTNLREARNALAHIRRCWDEMPKSAFRIAEIETELSPEAAREAKLQAEYEARMF